MIQPPPAHPDDGPPASWPGSTLTARVLRRYLCAQCLTAV
jgi:hypothetical protein